MVTETDPDSPVNADMWRAIGRLEGATAALLEGQREIKASLLEVQRETRAGLESANQRIDRLSHRIDRLFYAILAVSGALLAAVLASRFIGG
jgi:hypothetical protein